MEPMLRAKGKFFMAFLAAGGPLAALAPCQDLFTQPARPQYAPGLVPRVRTLQPRQSWVALADWFLQNRRSRRAWEIVAFGLAHNPRDHDLLVRAARINARFGDLETARVYCLQALEVRPGDSAMQALLERIEARTPRSPEAAAPETPPEKLPGAEGGDEAPEDSAPASEATTSPPLDLDGKLQILSLMRLVCSAMTAYNLRHPKKPLEEMDLEKLREEALLPADFEHPALAELSWSGDSCEHPEAGSQGELQETLGEYRKKLGDVEDWLARGHPHEALRDLEALREAHGSTRRIRAMEQKAWREIDPEKARKMAAGHQAETPGLTIQKGLELWRDGGAEEAAAVFASVAERWPESPHVGVARHLGRLAGKGFDVDFLDRFYQQRSRSLATSAPTTAAPEEGGGDDSAP